ncbi:sensor histidine kinase [Haloferula sp. BvORR071]|uniref:sensor histidine kinase n=1 Tax=Haloferula sp. BvORR071 TaxID=1396141 RepID=UPI002240F31D|nr:sensor histidine kinase [Haloferula sp. BvORR071]
MLSLRILCAAALALLAMAGGRLGAQQVPEENFSIRAWETDEGLPHNGVNGIFQSRDGFLWLATQGGLVRFNGIEFLQRRSELLDNPRASRVADVIEENDDTLLVACDVSGLVRLTKDGFSVHPLSAELGEGRRINAIFSEAPDVFWILRNDRNVWRWDHGKILHIAPPVGANAATFGTFARAKDGTIYVARGLGVERFDGSGLVRVPEIDATGVSITSSAEGGLWVASADSLWKWDGGALRLSSSTAPWSSAPPIAMLEDRRGAVWLGSKAHGIFRWAGSGFQQVKISHARIAALHEDREGNIWVGTSGGGLNLIQRARFQILGEQSGWTPEIEGCVAECPPGKVWFASGGAGLRELSGDRLLPPPDLTGWPSRAVPLYPGSDGHLWVGANTQLLRVTPDLSLPPDRVGPVVAGKYHAIHVARDGTVWAGGEDAVLMSVKGPKVTLYGPADGYTGIQAQAICEDASGAIWVGTELGDLFRGVGGHFTKLAEPPGLNGSGIRVLNGDAQGHVWIGTGGAGLMLWQGGKFSALTEEQGLPYNVISQMVEDDFGSMWFGTSSALFRADKAELLACAAGKIAQVTPVKYGKDDGLAGFSAAANYQPSSWKAQDGRLFFVSRKGIVIADPKQQRTDWVGPPVIEKLTVNGKPWPFAENRIPYHAQKLDFDFNAPTFVSPDKVRFRYRLAGLESEWNDAGNLRSASYAQLSAGSYQFEVQACNRELDWNGETASLKFVVLPAWWETWWARGLAVLLGAGWLIVAVRYWSHRRLKARLLELEATRRVDMERSRIARDLHDGLGAGLTQIGMMAEELAEDMNDPQEMKTYSTRIAGRVRGIARDLDAAVWTVSPKNDTLAALSSYIGQYAIEYFRETPVRCHVDLPEDIPDSHLSPDVRHHLFLMAKEIMNNVLKHSGASHVTLAIRTAGERFHLEIADDGHGFPADDVVAPARHGLKNIRERVAELGGSLGIRSSASGTAIAIELPLPKP